MYGTIAQELTHYSKRLKPYFAISIAIFAVAAVLGAVAVTYHAGLAKRLEQTLVGFVDNFRGLSGDRIFKPPFL